MYCAAAKVAWAQHHFIRLHTNNIYASWYTCTWIQKRNTGQAWESCCPGKMESGCDRPGQNCPLARISLAFMADVSSSPRQRSCYSHLTHSIPVSLFCQVSAQTSLPITCLVCQKGSWDTLAKQGFLSVMSRVQEEELFPEGFLEGNSARLPSLPTGKVVYLSVK